MVDRRPLLRSPLSLGLCALLGCRGGSAPNESRGSAGPDALAPAGAPLLPRCDPRQPVFTQLPHALADVQSLTPLGHVAPPGHTFPTDHMYFYLHGGGAVPLVSPGDLTVTRVSSTEYSTTPPSTDYAVFLRPCREVEIYFAHIKTP